MKEPSVRDRSFLARFHLFIGRYRVQALGTIAVLSTLSLIAAQVFPPVQDFLITAGIVPFVTLLIVLDLAATEHMRQEAKSVEAAANQDESLPILSETVAKCRRTRVDLLEYAGATTLPLIRTIRREGVPLRMLVKHPETIEGLQCQRMITTLDTLYNSVFEDYEGSFEIRCYRLPYSLRGRRLGEFKLELGWLTPDPKRNTAYGHANPSLLVDLSNSSNRFLLDFFDRTFDELWTASDTEDARSVLERMGS